MSADGLRIMLYSHNTRGFGHATRSIAVAWTLYQRLPKASILYCGGSLHEVSSLLPPNADHIKLPSFDAKKVAGKTKIVPARLRISRDQQSTVRRAILGSVAKTYQPQVLLADFFPLGKEQELVDGLDWMKSHPPSRVYLGFRDIIDDPAWTIRFLNSHLDSIRKYVDRVFIYGDPTLFDFVRTYQLPADIASRSTYTGYIVNRGVPWRSVEHIRSLLGVQEGQSLILASAGGGKDLADILLTIIRVQQLFADQRSLCWVVVGGPLAREEEWQRLQEAVRGTSIKLIRYWPVLAEVVNAADLFIGTCGYNLSAEIMATGTPAIFVPIARRVTEQTVRAEILSQHKLGQLAPFQPAETESRLASLLSDWLERPRSPKQAATIRTDGAEFIARCIEQDWHHITQSVTQSM
jgi:predicted glycosyltransferase